MEPTKPDEPKGFNEELTKKMDFEKVKDNREAFYKESEEFAGKEVEVRKKYICNR